MSNDQSNTQLNKSYHHGDLKEALLLASRHILNKKGVEALSLRAIAAEVGVSHMAPYSHFKNKKELFQAIAASGFNELAEKMLADSQSISKAPELVLTYGVTYITFAIDQPQLYRLMLGQVENAGRRHQVSLDTTKNTRQDLEKQVPESTELGKSSHRSFDLLAQAFAQIHQSEQMVKAQALGAWSMVHGMAALLIEGHFSIPESMSIKEFLAMATYQSPQ